MHHTRSYVYERVTGLGADIKTAQPPGIEIATGWMGSWGRPTGVAVTGAAPASR